MQHMLVDLIRRREGTDDRRRKPGHDGAVRDMRQDDGKFVAAKAPAKFARIADLPQAARHLAQQLVADLVAQRIVDRLEPVEVDHHEAAAGRTATRRIHRLIQHFAQMAAIGQAGQRIEARQLRDLVRRFALRRDVGADAAKTLEHAIFVMTG